jgi:hypothetical protein
LFSVPAPRQGLSALVPAHRLLRSGGARQRPPVLPTVF